MNDDALLTSVVAFCDGFVKEVNAEGLALDASTMPDSIELATLCSEGELSSGVDMSGEEAVTVLRLLAMAAYSCSRPGSRYLPCTVAGGLVTVEVAMGSKKPPKLKGAPLEGVGAYKVMWIYPGATAVREGSTISTLNVNVVGSSGGRGRVLLSGCPPKMLTGQNAFPRLVAEEVVFGSGSVTVTSSPVSFAVFLNRLFGEVLLSLPAQWCLREVAERSALRKSGEGNAPYPVMTVAEAWASVLQNKRRKGGLIRGSCPLGGADVVSAWVGATGGKKGLGDTAEGVSREKLLDGREAVRVVSRLFFDEERILLSRVDISEYFLFRSEDERNSVMTRLLQMLYARPSVDVWAGDTDDSPRSACFTRKGAGRLRVLNTTMGSAFGLVVETRQGYHSTRGGDKGVTPGELGASSDVGRVNTIYLNFYRRGRHNYENVLTIIMYCKDREQADRVASGYRVNTEGYTPEQEANLASSIRVEFRVMASLFSTSVGTDILRLFGDTGNSGGSGSSYTGGLMRLRAWEGLFTRSDVSSPVFCVRWGLLRDFLMKEFSLNYLFNPLGIAEVTEAVYTKVATHPLFLDGLAKAHVNVDTVTSKGHGVDNQAEWDAYVAKRLAKLGYGYLLAVPAGAYANAQRIVNAFLANWLLSPYLNTWKEAEQEQHRVAVFYSVCGLAPSTVAKIARAYHAAAKDVTGVNLRTVVPRVLRGLLEAKLAPPKSFDSMDEITALEDELHSVREAIYREQYENDSARVSLKKRAKLLRSRIEALTDAAQDRVTSLFNPASITRSLRGLAAGNFTKAYVPPSTVTRLEAVQEATECALLIEAEKAPS